MEPRFIEIKATDADSRVIPTVVSVSDIQSFSAGSLAMSNGSKLYAVETYDAIKRLLVRAGAKLVEASNGVNVTLSREQMESMTAALGSARMLLSTMDTEANPDIAAALNLVNVALGRETVQVPEPTPEPEPEPEPEPTPGPEEVARHA